MDDYDVYCMRCGASHLVENGEQWASEHAHPNSVIVTWVGA